MKLKKGDTVVVIAGKDRGKKGAILRVDQTKHRVVVEGVNIRKHHVKPRGTIPGGILEREGSIHVSNVMLICLQTSKRTRVGYRVASDGTKERFSKKSGQGITSTTPKKKSSTTKKN